MRRENSKNGRGSQSAAMALAERRTTRYQSAKKILSFDVQDAKDKFDGGYGQNNEAEAAAQQAPKDELRRNPLQGEPEGIYLSPTI